MRVLIVNIKVRADKIAEFQEATLVNAHFNYHQKRRWQRCQNTGR